MEKQDDDNNTCQKKKKKKKKKKNQKKKKKKKKKKTIPVYLEDHLCLLKLNSRTRRRDRRVGKRKLLVISPFSSKMN